MHPSLPSSRDKVLYTPGPLTTSLSVKQAMLHDAGSWHWEFNDLVRTVRDRILGLAGLSTAAGWECIPLQGSGTFGVEAVLASVVPPRGKVLVLANGAYGERAVLMLGHHRTEHAVHRTAENVVPDPADLDRLLAADPAITHVVAIHCETTTGILNPIERLGPVVRKHRRVFVVDAMSSFGAIPIDFEASAIDYLVSSANKCIEGVPGFSFVIGRRAHLESTAGWARSLSLDLLGQLRGFDKNGQFRYTPPTHSVLAFDQALRELELEGGPAGRAARYRRNHEVLLAGMTELGFRSYLPPAVQSYIITSFVFPPDPKFTFDAFYRRLSEQGHIIYPGKISQADTFRIGSIGRIFESDVRSLLAAVARTVDEMGLQRLAPAL
ncbi:MAG: 2-aminoethylphosphonate--pyruvate transaminase [Verrucomicrobiales bacterium]|nr:2-aminoethylphosphonate--pyruvate transaminase [Verrucomicrobiales bacterium]